MPCLIDAYSFRGSKLRFRKSLCTCVLESANKCEVRVIWQPRFRAIWRPRFGPNCARCSPLDIRRASPQRQEWRRKWTLQVISEWALAKTTIGGLRREGTVLRQAYKKHQSQKLKVLKIKHPFYKVHTVEALNNRSVTSAEGARTNVIDILLFFSIACFSSKCEILICEFSRCSWEIDKSYQKNVTPFG